mmetsp:Transcript_12718/g.12362  ORF Transcript_12718/g.12362 Transcript_12718/m.12362 type:complete len:256 (+) Transcript_12718:62-829(+)|eukprot:CAMPEP_0119040944 /NCGR_PEP_ID=MMETSP1177-20130426/11020_1 /TAXON_ID=2985 /ORGANISM="Ochromonas sp, Strain CCMP1899" /LENGTH=255 /DNA_ID=CAMNT_0007006501 /DNA_START=40 /DNA_END=807 /DNA_ORIENTATION=-
MNDLDFAPSSFGFRSIRPKSRDERRGMLDKVLLEKSRLDQRVGYEARQQQANAPTTSSLLTSCVSEGAGYISNADRFHSDTAGEEYAARQEALHKKNRAIEFRRNQSMAREEDRWQQIENKRNDDDEHVRRLQDSGTACKKNASNVAYDILSLQYNQDTGGEKQKYEDDMVRYRAQLRSRNLTIKGDTRSQFDIISGDPRQAPSYPSTVQPPDNAYGHGHGSNGRQSNAADSMVMVSQRGGGNQQQRGQGQSSYR